MVNYLRTEKKIMALNALVEGASIRSTERMTGVHRDTIMRLATRVGKKGRVYMDREMRNLDCKHIQIDEIWGFVGKKNANVKAGDDDTIGDIYCFVAMDKNTKLVPCFCFGDRTDKTVMPFVKDLAGRLSGRIQLSSDSLPSFYRAVLAAFGQDVDYGQVVKEYDRRNRNRNHRYSLPKFVKTKYRWILGYPGMKTICTSHVERQNLTIRTFVRRLTRLTCAFSKKLDNHCAAISLHFLHYNYVRVHGALKTTPAVAAGVADREWKMDDIVEMAA